MKLTSFGVPTYVIGGVVAACAAPAVTLNVWPRIEQMLTHGFNSNELGIVLLVTISALGMTAVPFAMQKAERWGFWFTCLTFGISLAILNYVMAVGAIGKLSDHATAQATAAMSKAESLKTQLEELRSARRELGAFKPTTPEMLAAADDAVRLATEARDQECGRVGDFCRARVAQLQSRLSERAETGAHRALTLRAGEITSRITNLNEQIQHSGALPVYADPQAERIKALLVLLWPTLATTQVANGIIHMLAIAAELFAFGMPRILVAALGRPTVPVTAGRPSTGLLLNTVRTPIPASKKPIRAITGPPARTPPPINGASTSLAEWKAKHLQPELGRRLKCWDAWKHYEAKATDPGSFTSFDYELTNTLGVRKEVGSRSFYVDVVLKR